MLVSKRNREKVMMEKFVETLYKNLTLNGFPNKRVSLPTEKMYEVADNKNLSLNKALETLSETYDLVYEIGDDKILFEAEVKSAEDNLNFSNLDQNEMFKKAQEFLSKMDPAEIQKMQEQVMNMSESEKEELLRKGKDLGIM